LLLSVYNTSEMDIQKRKPFKTLLHILIPIRRIARIAGSCAVVFGAGLCSAQPVDVFAAASLKPALDAIAVQYARETGQALRLSYAASSVLARQIEQGAPTDVFVSASSDWMSYVHDAGVFSQSARVIAANRLVLASATPAAVTLEVEDIMARLDGGRLAVPLISSVPLGLYAAQALTTLGLLHELRPHLAQQDNARASLIAVLRQECPLGLLYASDVQSTAGVYVVANITPETHEPVRYLAAPVTARGEAVVAYLAGATGREVFAAQGFLAP